MHTTATTIKMDHKHSSPSSTSTNASVMKQEYREASDYIYHYNYPNAFISLQKINRLNFSELKLTPKQLDEIFYWLLKNAKDIKSNSIYSKFLIWLFSNHYTDPKINARLIAEVLGNIKLPEDVQNYLLDHKTFKLDLLKGFIEKVENTKDHKKLKTIKNIVSKTDKFRYIAIHQISSGEEIHELLNLAGSIDRKDDEYFLSKQIDQMSEEKRNDFFQHIIDFALTKKKSMWCDSVITAVALKWKDALYEKLIATVRLSSNTDEKMNKLADIKHDEQTTLHKIFKVKRGRGRYFTCCSLFRRCGPDAYGTFDKIEQEINKLMAPNESNSLNQPFLELKS